MIETLNELSKREENWDGHGSAKPKVDSVAKAKEFIQHVGKLSNSLISNNQDGIVTLECWNDKINRKITLHFYPDKVEYLKIYDSNIDDGITSFTDFKKLHDWLYG